ncbi:MAG: hypothetical protein AB7C98_11405 [Acidithiobacillus sp.]
MKVFKAEPFHRYSAIAGKAIGLDRLFWAEEKHPTGFNRRMFDEDFGRMLLSLNRHDDALFKIDSSDAALTQRLLSNIETRYSSRSVEKILCELIEEIGQSLILSGKAYYFLYEASEQDEIHIMSFNSEGVAKIFSRYIQWVPKRKEEHWGRDDEEHPREIRILDASKAVSVKVVGTCVMQPLILSLFVCPPFLSRD